jgi:adenylate cyclase
MRALTQTQKLFFRGILATTILSAAVVLGIARTRPMEWLEAGTYDARMRWTARPSQSDSSVVIIDVDNASLQALDEKLGRWPWTRRVWTEVVRYVARGKPRAIVIDAIFGGSENPQVDEEFARVIHDAGTVVLGYSFSPTQMEVVDTTPEKQRLELLRAQSSGAADMGERINAAEHTLNLPLAQLAQAAAGLGCVNSVPDPDGSIRRIPLQYLFENGSYPGLAARAADVASGDLHPRYLSRTSRFGSRYVLRFGRWIPVDASGRMLLLWNGDSFVHPRLPLWQVICSIYPDQCPEQKPYFPVDYFRGKIVLVGASAAGGYDSHTTPFSESAPGFVAHATAIDNLLHGQALRQAPRWVLVTSVLIAAVLGTFFIVRFTSLSAGLPFVLLLVALYGGASLLVFQHWRLWLPLVAPVGAMLLSYSSAAAVRYATTGRELRRTRGTLDRYLSPQLVKYVLEHLGSIQLAGEKRELTILISDVRNFTTMSEKADPLELIALLDEYLAAMTDIIFRYDGIVDKFIGDGILAYWGAFTPGNHARGAACAALEMIRRLAELNERWKAQGRAPIAIGIGINTGTVIFGNLGRGKKIEFTVIGDAVNLTSRLESLNKEFGTSIIVSKTTRDLLGDEADVRALGGVKVKGKTTETTVFELLGLKPAEAPGAEPVTVLNNTHAD